jgi:hypothetical protein
VIAIPTSGFFIGAEEEDIVDSGGLDLVYGFEYHEEIQRHDRKGWNVITFLWLADACLYAARKHLSWHFTKCSTSLGRSVA